jgi:hypothetical protein
MSAPGSTTPNGFTLPALARTLRGLSRLCDAWGATAPPVMDATVATRDAMWTVSVVVDMVATELETLATPPSRGTRRGRRRTAAAPDDNVRWLTRRLRELGESGATDGL